MKMTKQTIIYLILFGFLVCTNKVKAQNYIYNAGFDDYIYCPTASFPYPNGNTLPWETVISGGGLFNICSPYLGLTTISASVPNNCAFYQNQISGGGFAGFYSYFNDTSYLGNIKGYLQQKFRKPLVAGKKYYIGYSVSLADKSMYATNSLGVYLSNNVAVVDTVYPYLHQNMQLVNTTQNLTDTANWQKLSWIYTAQGGEKHILIGSNRPFNNLDTVTVGVPLFLNGIFQKFAFYLIEDVFLIPVTGSSQKVCSQNNSTALQSNVIGTKYLWSNGDTTSNIVVNQNGIYTLLATHDSLYRVDTFNVVLNHPTNLVYNYLPNEVFIYQGASIGLQGPSGANYTYYWSNGDTAQNVVVNTNGIYILQLTAQDGCMAFDTCEVKYITDLNSPSKSTGNLSLIPNPSNGSFIISSTQATYNNVIIYSIDGKEVYHNKLTFTKGNANFDLDLPNGVYHVKLIGSSGVASQKLVISK